MATKRQVKYINSLISQLEQLGHDFSEQRTRLSQGLSVKGASTLIDELHENILELYPGWEDFLAK